MPKMPHDVGFDELCWAVDASNILGKLRCLLHDHSICLDKLGVLWLHDHFLTSVFLKNSLELCCEVERILKPLFSL